MAKPPRPTPETDLDDELETQGEIVPTSDFPNLTRAQVAKILNVSRATVRRMQARGQLKAEIRDGISYFSEKELERVKESDVAEETEDEPNTVAEAAARAGIELVRSSMQHANKAAELYFEPAQAAYKQLLEVNKRLMDRNAQLESTHLELVKAREEALNEQQIRNLAAKEHEAKVENRRIMLNKAIETLPWVTTALAERLGLSPVSTKLAAFLRVLDPQKLQLMLAPSVDLLSDTEKQALAELLDAVGMNPGKTEEAVPSTPE